MTESIQCSVDHPCAAVQLLAKGEEDHKERMDRMDVRMDKTDQLLESVRNRPPLWMTAILTSMGTVIGVLAGHVKF